MLKTKQPGRQNHHESHRDNSQSGNGVAGLAPSGPPNRTQDIELHAGTADFDDSTWEQIKPAQLEERRSTGRLCFNWYRTIVTIPDKIDSFDPTGSTAVFEIAIDDYAEVRVDGKLPLVLGQPGGQLIKGFNAPNSITLSPDEKALYVNNWNDNRNVILRYDVNPDCTLAKGAVFFDITNAPGSDALDGLKVDRKGNVYATGSGGLWINLPEGKQLGLIKGPEDPHNMAWGDDDGRVLYITALTGIYRIRMNVQGVRSWR